MMTILPRNACLIFLSLFILAGCSLRSSGYVYHDPNMDFGSLHAVAVMPFANFSRENMAADRVRDVFTVALLSTGALYVVPVGEVARGVAGVEVRNPTNPSPEEAIKLGNFLKVQAVITGVLREYGEVRSGAASASVISVSLEMMETQTGKVVWTASSTKGGIDAWDRLLGGGGKPMDDVTRTAVNDLVNKLFK
jgi:hypothetical protein